MSDWHIAELNVARLRQPIDAPETAGFVANLDPVNAIADAAPGFVWRLQDDSGNATSIHTSDDPRFIVNLSVWESIETLEAFVRRTPHADVLRRRREWFERATEAYLVLWWIPAGTRPSVDGRDGPAAPPARARPDGRSVHVPRTLRPSVGPRLRRRGRACDRARDHRVPLGLGWTSGPCGGPVHIHVHVQML